MTLTLIVAFACFFFVGSMFTHHPAAAAGALFEIPTCETTIVTSTILDGDMSCAGSGITIGANDIELDCSGHTIRYAQETAGEGIRVQASRVTVRNCRIVQDTTLSNTYALRVFGSHNVIENNTITTSGTNVGFGIQLDSSAFHNTVVNNRISAAGRNSIGLRMVGGGGNVAKWNILAQTHPDFAANPFVMVWGSQNTLAENSITTTADWAFGIEVRDGPDNVIERNLITTDGSGGGVYVFISFRNVVKDNTIDARDAVSTEPDASAGIHVQAGGQNRIEGNTITSAANGIRFQGSPSNTIVRNTITAVNGFSLGVATTRFNAIFDNFVRASNPVYIQSGIGENEYTGPNTWNTAKTAGPNIVGGPFLGGNFWSDLDDTGFSQICSDGDPDGFCDAAFVLTAVDTDTLPLTFAPSLPWVNVVATDSAAKEFGAETGAFTVSRTGSTDAPLAVLYSVSGSATPGSDYTALPGMVVIPAGSTSAWIVVAPIDDGVIESAESVVVTLSDDPAYIAWEPNTAAVAITDGRDSSDLIVTSLKAPKATIPGGTISVQEKTVNQGKDPAPPSITRFVLSTNQTLDASDVVLTQRSVGILLPAGASSATTTVPIPSSIAPGKYFLIAVSDATGTATEINESNNTARKSLAVGPDLQLTAIAAPAAATIGATIAITDTTKNIGGDAAPSETRFFLSIDQRFDRTDIPLGSRSVPALGTNASSSGTSVVTIPAITAPRAYYVLGIADGAQILAEINENNNRKTVPITITH